MIWPDFCSALIVGRLAPLGLHNTRFRSVPVSCSPRTGADASSPRHETHRNVANSRSLKSWKGLRRQTSSVLYAPSALSAMALSYESPTVPVEGSMPNSPTLVVYTRLMYCAPWYATPHSLQRKPQRMSDPSSPPTPTMHQPIHDPRTYNPSSNRKEQQRTPPSHTRVPYMGGSQPCHRPRHLKP